jgi:hypothetical protein
MDAYDKYRRGYQGETKWIVLLKNQILDYQRQQQIYKQQREQLKMKYASYTNLNEHSTIDSVDEEIKDLKKQVDPIAVGHFLKDL